MVLAIILIIIGIALCIPIFLALLFVAAYVAAKHNKQATFVKEGTMKFVMYGENYNRTLANIAGYYYKRGEGDFIIQVGEVDPNGKPLPIGDDPSNPLYTLPAIKAVPGPVKVVNAIVPLLTREEEQLPSAIQKEEIRQKKKREEESWFQQLGHKWANGFYWVSFLYPYGHLHSFNVSRIKLKEYALGQMRGGMSISDIVQEEESLKGADFLLWQFPRPIIVREIEFKDFQTADIVLGTLLQVVMPYRPVFAYQGNFFPLISSAVQSTVIDFCRDFTLQDFIRYFKTGYAVAPPTPGEKDKESAVKAETNGAETKITDFFLRAISRINCHSDMPPHGVIEEYGIWVRNAWIVAIIPTSTDEARKALQAQSIAEMKGKAGVRTAQLGADAAREEAKGIRDSKEIAGDGESKRLQKLLVALGGSVDALNQYLKIEQRKSTPGLGTLVEGDAKTGVVISIPSTTPSTKPPEPPSKQ